MNRFSHTAALAFLITLTVVMVLLAADPKFHNKQGIELGEKKMYEQAVEEFDKSIDTYDKESSRVLYNRGWALESKGDFKAALISYEESLKRNPGLTIAGEKLGFLHYRLGDYISAVRVGEHVMKIEPDNKEVPKWLPDAYMKKLQQEKDIEAARKKAEDEQKKKDEEKRLADQEKKDKEGQILLATIDFTLRSGYYFKDKNEFKYVSDPGLFIDVPEKLFVSFTPIQSWEFTLTLENPYLGALSPNVNIHYEKLDARYLLGDFMLGAGIMFNHYEGKLAYGSNELWDFKAGFIFGFKKDKMEMKFELYPRLIPYDGKSSTGRTYDFDMLKLDYRYTISPELKFYSIMNFRDYYIFNHTLNTASYWGAYEIGVGMTLGQVSKTTNKINYSFSVEFTERFYLENLDNDDPYSSLPNGQGVFGMDKGKWLKGSPFSGFKAFGHVLGLRVDEQLKENIFLYQKLIIEIGDMDVGHHEFSLVIGAGYIL